MTVNLPIGDDENRLINRLLAEIHKKALRNRLRASYYDQKQALSRMRIGSVVPPEYLRLGIVLGWSAKAVDILARRCNLDAFVWPDGDLDSLGWRQVWDDNSFATESNSGMVSSLIHSVSFLINTVGTEGEPGSLIHVKDALNATGDWNARTRRLDNLLSVTGRDDERNPTGLVLYLNGKTIDARKDQGKWSVEVTEHPWGVPAEPLVYRPRAGRPFGSSRISRAVMSLQDRATKACLRMEGHADVYSIPQMIINGAGENAFKNPDGSIDPKWKIAMGRIFMLPDDEDAPPGLERAEIKQFQAASPAPHIDMLKQVAQMFSGETSIPLSSLGVSDMSNPTSAESYIASREDLIAEAEGATDDWAPAFRRTMIRALAIANGEDGVPAEWSTIDAKFRSPLYLSRAAQADAGLKQLTAAPWLAETEVGLELLGLDDQQIQRAMAEKRRVRVSSLMDRLMADSPTISDVAEADSDAVGNVAVSRPAV
ncbi:phage portal protein [Mycolicibacter heraklionensis]|uniref:phage portal protein n=1 Tax=Mycolicibacter heraklionensis TaxID=512402 RepID=UPI00292D6D07|nr:phage portal protein [Mycolicibacter heraklionensis]